jgi:hypothetical protein
VSLRVAVAIPFRQEGVDRLGEGAFVVALSLDRDWFSPDQAKRLIDVAAARGLVERTDGDLVAAFDPGTVTVPDEFAPDESLLAEGSVFEQVLDAVVADGAQKRAAVAAINERQRDLEITLEAAAILHARERGLDVTAAADRARADLRGTDAGDG